MENGQIGLVLLHWPIKCTHIHERLTSDFLSVAGHNYSFGVELLFLRFLGTGLLRGYTRVAIKAISLNNDRGAISNYQDPKR